MGRISMQGVNKTLGSNHVVADLDLEIEDRELVALLGPSGCGKTTTLRLLAGFLAPDSGRIVVDGKVFSTRDRVVPPERRHMGMVFQQYAVWPHMTVEENVAFGLRLQKVSRGDVRARVADGLRLVGLTGFEKRRPSDLSGGQQQRVALARALVIEPTILLLDEPLSNLDAQMRERMRFELKELQNRTGITFVYVTHDQAEAMALADRVAVMEKGSVVQWGPPRDVYEAPANRFVADFLGTVNWLAGSVATDATVALEGGRMLKATLPEGARPGEAVTLAIRPEDVVLDLDPPRVGDNVLAATVREALFLGNLVFYEVDAGDVTVLVQTLRSQDFAVGQKVYASIASARCRPVAATTSASQARDRQGEPACP